MTRQVTFGRCAAVNPGKHGTLDWKVTFRGEAPTLAELVFMVGMTLLAEDRYWWRGCLGRYMPWYFLDRLCLKKSPEAIVDVANDCAEVVADRSKLFMVGAR